MSRIRQILKALETLLVILARCFFFASLLLLLAPESHAQQRELYDTRTGKVVGRSTTDSGGATTIYGSNGRVVARSAADTAGTTVVYDAVGRYVATIAATKIKPAR